MTESDKTISELKAIALKAKAVAPGQWEHDTETSDGAYGSGPDARHGFATYLMLDGEGRRLFDAHGSEVADIHEEYDEDGGHAWDEISRRVFDFLAAFNPARVLSILEEIEALKACLEGAEEAFDWLARNKACELSYGCDDPECDGTWRIHRVSGNVNDREWTLVSADMTPLLAIRRAMLAESMAAVAAPLSAKCPGEDRQPTDVRSSDLRANIADYLRRAEAGERFVIKHYDRAVAILASCSDRQEKIDD